MNNPFELLAAKLDKIENLLTWIAERPEQEETEQERLLDKKQAAKVLGVSVSTIDNMRRDGFLTPYRFGKAVRFKLSDLYELTEKRKAS
ncbi:MAG: hypothetical protein DA408_14475 [Bacteroidetes bacterium]|nr:MAG: hypothetical protein DA408_14475 [Bacteroidota bacterium]